LSKDLTKRKLGLDFWIFLTGLACWESQDFSHKHKAMKMEIRRTGLNGLEGKKTEPNRTWSVWTGFQFGSVRFQNLKKNISIWLFFLNQNRTEPEMHTLTIRQDSLCVSCITTMKGWSRIVPGITVSSSGNRGRFNFRSKTCESVG
jgi:hypothetical protein